MNNQLLQQAKQRTSDFEGCKLYVYTDTEGYPTIGRGHRVLDHELEQYKKHGISQAGADELFDEDFASHTQEAYLFPEWGYVDEIRQMALLDMIFQMGRIRVMGFEKMRHNLRKGLWEAAAWQIVDSRYFKQTQERALSNAHIIDKGVIT